MTTNAKWSDFASLDGPKTVTAANQLLPAWVSLLLVVLIGWQLSQLVWTLVPSPAANVSLAAPTVGSSGSGDNFASSDASQIAGHHIFGEHDPAVVIVETPPSELENLPESSSSLSLKGTLAATNEDQAIAIIADTGAEEKIYVVGDTIKSGIKLHAVYVDRVVLDERGNLRNLKLPKDFPQTASAPVRRNNTQVTRTTAPSQSLQAVVAQNVTKLSEVIRPTPYFDGGQQQGYRVYPGRNRQQFAALGLRPGDIIKSIDGQSLTDPQQAMQIFQSLGTTDQVSVTVERNGQQEVLVLSTSQLDLGDDTEQ
ncbi:MAG: type II secretion system protein GspC [Pseudomonadota bacterium]